MTKDRLSAFDRLGLGVVSTCGFFLGLGILFVSDINPGYWFFVMFPGALPGALIAKITDIRIGAITSAVLTGAAYGLALYAWYRLPDLLARSIPKLAKLKGYPRRPM